MGSDLRRLNSIVDHETMEVIENEKSWYNEKPWEIYTKIPFR